MLAEKTDDSSKALNKARLKETINALKNARSKGSLIPSMADRMNAGKILDKIFENEQILLPVNPSKTKFSRENAPPIQKDIGSPIVGSDATSLFPALRGVETARLARCAV